MTNPGAAVRLSILLVTTSSHTIQKAKLTVDGRDVATAETPTGSGQVTLQGTVSGLQSGRHTLRIFILQQASSPNLYFASGAIETPTRILDLAAKEGLLKTGEALEMEVSF